MPGNRDVLFRFRSTGLADDLFQVVRLDGREALSDLYEFRLELVSKDPDIEIGGVLQNNATIEMELGGDVVYVHGIVSTFMQCDRGPEWINYEAVVVPRLFTLGLNRQCQIYQDKDTPTIVRELLEEDGLKAGEDFEFRLSRTDYPASEYVVQYQESDLDFMRRLLEHVGIFFYFEQSAEREKLILTDSREAYGVISGDPVVPYRDARGVNPGGEAVESLRLRQELRARRVMLKDYNWRAPSVEMQAEAAAAAAGRGTFMEYGDHFKSPEEGRALATIRGEEVACREVVYQGRSACRAFRAGARFTLIDHFRTASNMEYLLVEVRHKGEQLGVVGTASGGEADRPGYLNEFEAIPAAVQFRPARVTPKPRIHGTLNAVIDGVSDGGYAELDDLGRYKVRLPFDVSNNGAGKASRHIRMAQPYAGEDGGMHFPLLKGTEVILTHVDGDPDRPIISAAVPNVATNSPVTGNNQTQGIIQTQGQNRIVMEDQEGDRFVHLSTPEETNGSTFLRLGNANTALQDVIPTEPPPQAPTELPNPTVTIDPLGKSVMLEGSLQFNATVVGATDLRVQWSLESGGVEQGSITEQGLFTAPPDLPAATTVTIRATSVANPAKFAEATVVLYAPYVEPVNIYMVPPGIRMEISETQILEAIVVGTANKAVTWSVVEGSTFGSVSAQGIYTPPNTMPNPSSLPNTVTVRATCVADPSKHADCVISLYPEGSRTQGIVSVTVSPRGISLGPSATQTFTALVTNAGQNQAVTWEVIESGGGSIDAATGLFTAPASFASPMLVTIRARSAANNARFGDAQIILYQPAVGPVDIYVVAPDDTVQGGDTVQLTAIVTGPNHLVDWTVVGNDANNTKGTVSTAGVFTAPAGTATQDVTVRATSQADPTKHADHVLHLVPMGTLVEVVVNPGSATVVATKTQLFTAFVRGSLNQAVTWSLSGKGTKTVNADGSCTYTAPAADDATGTATLTATSVANPARSVAVTITLIAKGQISTFMWDKITEKLNAMKAAGYSEGDITIAANNSVSLYRQNYIQETQADNYSNVEGDSWARVNGENHQKNESNVYVTNEHAVLTMTKLGSLTATFLANVNLIAGFQLTGTLGLAVNVTTLGAWANIVLGGLAIEAFFGAKITVNKGRNFKFFDVDDYEVIDKTSVTAARNGVSLQCGPENTTTGILGSLKEGILELLPTAPDPAPHTTGIELKPKDITIEVKAASGHIEAKVEAISVLKMEKAKVTLANSGAAKLELAADAVNITGKSKVTGDFEVDGALTVKGVPVPPPPPPDMPTVDNLNLAVKMAQELKAFQESFVNF